MENLGKAEEKDKGEKEKKVMEITRKFYEKYVERKRANKDK